MRNFVIFLLRLSFLVFSFSGCELYYRRPVEISLPDCPGAEGWIVEYPERITDGRIIFAIETAAADTDGPGTVISVDIARGLNLPVLARPVYSGITGGFPAGAVYPADAVDGALRLNWEDGFACEILKACRLNSDVVSAFDTLRFRDALLQKTAELNDPAGEALPGGCWLIDPVPILSRLGYGLFRESSIKAAPVMSFSIPVLGGAFVSDNPFYPELESSETSDGAVLTVLIPVNRRTLFFNHGAGETVEVFFDDIRWCWINLLTQASGSGRL